MFFAESMYTFSFEITVGQVKHFFVDKNLDFTLLDPTKPVPGMQEEDQNMVEGKEENQEDRNLVES